MLPLSPSLLKALARVLDRDALLTDTASCLAYGYDNSRYSAQPQAVALASDHAQIAEVVRLCAADRVPLTARGRGTGTTGATVPIHGGLVLSMERMERILEIDTDNRLARVQAGVTNLHLQEALKTAGFFWPPDPTSAATCTIGGNLAYNSAGPRAVKYGTPRENTLGLKAVTGTGETLITGTRTTKGVVGYDLTRLLIGSEGTLAVITEATLKLTPLPDALLTLSASYRSIEAAAQAVARIMAQPVIPYSLEFMDAAALQLIRDGYQALPEQAQALLIIEVDGPAQQLAEQARALGQAAGVPGLLALETATDAQAAAALWQARKRLSPALRRLSPRKINEDVVVPVSRIPELIHSLRDLSQEYAIPIVNFGHAGNGNIHVNLLPSDQPEAMARAHACLERVFERVLSLGGSLSGEHGVGLDKRPYVARELDPVALRLMHAIKAQFDPCGILNPGKTLPE